MQNILLLSSMDGTNILFSPFLQKIDENVTVKCYNLNEHSNQEIAYQVQQIEQFILTNFSGKPVTLIAESYSGLLVFNLLTARPINSLNITNIVFIGGFLECPSWLARFANWFDPSWAKALPDNILGHLLFNRWHNQELIHLFRQVLAILSEPNRNEMFKYRLTNIAKARLPDMQQQINIPCLYLQATRDNLVKSHNSKAFQIYFADLKVEKIQGTHFLLQTNPVECWQAIKNFIQESKIN